MWALQRAVLKAKRKVVLMGKRRVAASVVSKDKSMVGW
jgi:hypothetical protein